MRALGKEFGHLEATEVTDGESLSSALGPGTYDLAITDYQLQRSTGLDVLPRIKRRMPDCPVIMFTATGSEEIAVNALKQGLDDYVIKSPRHFVKLASVVRATLDRKRDTKRARLLEAKLQDLLTRLNVGLCRTDMQGRLLYANLAFQKLFGIYPADLSGNAEWRFDSVLASPEQLAKLKEDLEHNGQAVASNVPARTLGDRELWLDITQSVSMLPESEFVIETLVEDVSERHRQEEASRVNQEAAMETRRMESIGRLAGGVAHDFNNLLTAINGYSDLMLSMLDEGSALRENILSIRKAGSRAAALTRDLLAFGRRQMLQPRLVEMNGMVLGMENRLRELLGRDILLEVSLAPTPMLVRCDPAQIETVFANLAVNAKFALPRGGHVRIQTGSMQVREEEGAGGPEYRAMRPLQPGNYAVISLEDDGEGLEPQALARIFEPFYTAQPLTKGAGMGLATSYGIVKQSGGHVFADSIPGKGTRFRVCLPRHFLPGPVGGPMETAS
jgi:PAS domain S-box-containing protein